MTKKTSLLNKMFPLLGTEVNSRCFRVTYGLVLAGIVGLLGAAAITGEAHYFELAVCLLFSAFLGQVIPFYPMGIVSLFLMSGVIVTSMLAPPQPSVGVATPQVIMSNTSAPSSSPSK